MINRSHAGPYKTALISLAAVAAAISCTAAFASTTSPAYTVTNLGTLGGPTSSGYALNALGDTTGVSTLNSGTNNHDAFLETKSQFLDLGTLGGTYSTGQAINYDKMVVGEATTSAGWYHAFVYITTPMRDLGTLGGNQSDALGINNKNVIVGTATDTGGQFHAFYYENAKMTKIPISNNYYSEATAINQSNMIVGEWTPSAGTTHAFLYSLNKNVFTDLRAPKGDTSAQATAINGKGFVVGVAGSGSTTGFLWLPSRFIVLPSLGGTQTAAEGINNNNDVVGYSYTSSGVSHAFLYSNPTKTMTDLNNEIDPSSGWVLSAAYGINLNGQIVGVGTYNGAERGFLLTPVSATAVANDDVGPPAPPPASDLESAE